MTIELTKDEMMEAYLALKQRARSSGSGTRSHTIFAKMAARLEEQVRIYQAEKELAKLSNGHDS